MPEPSSLYTPRVGWLFVAGLGLAALVGGSQGQGQAPAARLGKQETAATELYFGVDACVDCHSEGTKRKPVLCRCTEVAIWKDADKHQKAWEVLKGDRAKQMGRLLWRKEDVTREKSCVSCHGIDVTDPHLVDGGDVEKVLADGVSCAVCHGSYKEWVSAHAPPLEQDRKTWRSLDRLTKEQKFGMTDLWDPVKRAALCASCHVGSRGPGSRKFVTHEMYAAGHPPLPGFEVATFSEQMPRHWEYLAEKKSDEVKKLLGYDGHAERAHLVLVGAAVAFRESMKLLEAEAAECAKAPAGERMLDLATFDCYACHHDLRAPGWRQVRGYVGKPGRPQPRPWPVSPLRLLLHYLAADEKEAEAEEKALKKMMADVHAAFDSKPFGDPAAIQRVLQKPVLPWAQDVVVRAARKKPSKEDAGRLAALIPQLFKDRLLDYDEARQVAWMFKTLHDEAHGPPAGAVKEALDDVKKILRLKLPAGKEQSIEKELDQNLKALNDYNPRDFQKALTALGAALAKPLK